MNVFMYHATERAYAQDIVANGFLGGWGDAGFGVYFYDNVHDAVAYAQAGGWDNTLVDPVILRVDVTGAVERVVPHPAWPNPEKYEVIWVHEMDQEDEDVYWRPPSVELLPVMIEVQSAHESAAQSVSEGRV